MSRMVANNWHIDTWMDGWAVWYYSATGGHRFLHRDGNTYNALDGTLGPFRSMAGLEFDWGDRTTWPGYFSSEIEAINALNRYLGEHPERLP